jgi:hypothetical protein
MFPFYFRKILLIFIYKYRDIQWSEMIKIGVSPILVVATMKYYEKSMMLVQLEDDLSKPFFYFSRC